MKNLGAKTIETNRLILRKFKENDAEYMFKNWASDEDVTKYLTWPAHKTLEVSKRVCKIWEDESTQDDKYQWAIELKSIKEVIGAISVVNIFENIECVEVGYCIGKNYWNKGIVTEAFKEVLNFLFNEINVNKVIARHDTKNVKSGKVMIKCGLKYEGTSKQGDRNNTGICDVSYYGITRDEYYNVD